MVIVLQIYKKIQNKTDSFANNLFDYTKKSIPSPGVSN